MKKTEICHISQTIRDIITIFGMVLDIHPGIISITLCAILPQKIRVIEISCFCGYLLFRKSFIRKHWKSRTNLHSICIFVGHIYVRRFVPCNQEIWFTKIYLKSHNFQIQVMKYTFSSNVQNCGKTPFFHHSREKILGRKVSWIFATIPHNTCNFIMQNTSSFL